MNPEIDNQNKPSLEHDPHIAHIHMSEDQTFANPWDIDEKDTRGTTVRAPQSLYETRRISVSHAFRNWVITTLITLPIAILVGVGAWLSMREPVTQSPESKTLQRQPL